MSGSEAESTYTPPTCRVTAGPPISLSGQNPPKRASKIALFVNDDPPQKLVINRRDSRVSM